MSRNEEERWWIHWIEQIGNVQVLNGEKYHYVAILFPVASFSIARDNAWKIVSAHSPGKRVSYKAKQDERSSFYLFRFGNDASRRARCVPFPRETEKSYEAVRFSTERYGTSDFLWSLADATVRYDIKTLKATTICYTRRVRSRVRSNDRTSDSANWGQLLIKILDK